jgi:hypothetical protein
VIVPDELDHLPKRKVKDLYKYGKWDIKREKKWVEMSSDARLTFSKNAVALREKNAGICYKAIVENKQNANANFRRDSKRKRETSVDLLSPSWTRPLILKGAPARATLSESALQMLRTSRTWRTRLRGY